MDGVSYHLQRLKRHHHVFHIVADESIKIFFAAIFSVLRYQVATSFSEYCSKCSGDATLTLVRFVKLRFELETLFCVDKLGNSANVLLIF